MKDLEARHKNDVLVIEVDLFRASAAEAINFRNVLDWEIARGYNDIVIDLTKCSFIDSAFIGALVVTKKKLELSYGQLRLIITNKIIQNAEHLARTISVFDSYHSIHDALSKDNSSNVDLEVKTERMCAVI